MEVEADDFFGEMSSLLGGPSTYAKVTTEESVAAVETSEDKVLENTLVEEEFTLGNLLGESADDMSFGGESISR